MGNARWREADAAAYDSPMHDVRDVGGTPGGLPEFVVGLGLTGLGAYLFMDRVTVHGGYWNFYGSSQTSFGITLFPVMIGIGALFYNGKSPLGWILFVGGMLAIFAGIIANLQVHFRSTTLTATLIILGLLAAGIGLMLKALRPHGTKGDG